MNLETGEIREFATEEELQEAIKTGKWIKVRCRPNPKCETCKGKGYKGIDSESGLYIPCDCISYSNYIMEQIGGLRNEENEGLEDIYKKLLKKRDF